jgi:hypothetical protein
MLSERPEAIPVRMIIPTRKQEQDRVVAPSLQTQRRQGLETVLACVDDRYKQRQRMTEQQEARGT